MRVLGLHDLVATNDEFRADRTRDVPASVVLLGPRGVDRSVGAFDLSVEPNRPCSACPCWGENLPLLGPWSGA